MRGGVTPLPTPTGPSLWCDASNYTGPLSDQQCADLRAAGIVGVVIQAITGNDGKSYTQQQLSACARNGLRVGGYVWVFAHSTPLGVMSRLAMFNGHALEHLWADVEESGITRADVDLVLGLCDNYLGRPAGVYTAHYFFQDQGWLNETRWSNRPLWAANFNHKPVVGAGFVPFGGWTKPTMSQYAGTSSIGSVHQLDLDVM